MKDEYLVSIRLMTYNHAAFINDAMVGVMMQKTNFKVELVVGDDFSTDNTLEIIRGYKNTENITIKILDRNINDEYWQKRQSLGRLYNFVNILENCTGKYIAFLDGDDYWTNPLKLQKQVDFLETEKECVSVFHAIYCKDQSTGSITPDSNGMPTIKKYFDLDDFLEYSNFAAIASLMARSEIVKNMPHWFTNVAFGDFALNVISAKQGKIGFINEEMAVYRVHGGGLYSSTSKQINQQKELDLYNMFDKQLGLGDRMSWKIGKKRCENRLNSTIKQPLHRSLLQKVKRKIVSLLGF